MTTPRADSRLGTDLGPYHIESIIGRGGMGVVYLADERRLKRRVALKVLPPELAGDTDFRARFERESQMAAAIDDPNILPVYEAGEVDGVLFIAMRYVEGTDLETRLAGPDVIEGFDLTTGTDVRGWDVVDRLARDLEATAGPCGLTGAASEVWQADGDDRGAVVCYADAETADAVITWSQDDFVLYRAVASDGDRAGLLRGWQENAPNMAP